jgi:hypothetical protein
LEIATPNATPTVRTRRDAMLSNNAFQKICRACFKTIAPLNPFSYDYERVEKFYLQFWDSLYSQNKVSTPEPIITNWKTIRNLEKGLFNKNISVDTIQQAIKKSETNQFCIQNGYSLQIILSSNVMNQLLNGCIQQNPAQEKLKSDMPSFF